MRKHCNKCNKYFEEEFKFCPDCGYKLEKQYSELGEKYRNPYGSWSVTTEGDCEGRSIKDLGMHKGYIDEIALALADKCYYSLTFHAIEELKEKDYTKKRSKVSVTLDIDSKTWDMSQEERCEVMKDLFKDRNIKIEKGQYYASFIISKED